ncbi:MAG: tetratricopeptide repeat protein [Fulvimarina manganoxydans]|nr:tetratricopeptide repeat protein [Fulvimarina manganoxydans]MCK5930657.1 tetratricopeptide repeat protein [Fulvimarina manganoxydans]
MSDESFFREVSEELRQDRIKAIWTRFGTLIVTAIVLILLATAAYVGWERYATSEANASGDRYLAAQDLVREGKTDEAIAAFRELAADGWGAYPELARLSIANAEAASGDAQAAIASYGDVAGDSSVPQPLRDMADLRAAYLLVDAGSLADVRGRAERLTGEDNALRYAAREAIGLAAWKAGETETAADLFQTIVDAGDAPSGIAQRARLMLELIAAEKPAPAASATPSDGAATEAPAGAAEPANTGGSTAPAGAATSEQPGAEAPAAASPETN